MRGSSRRWRMLLRSSVKPVNLSGRWVRSGWKGRSRSSRVETDDGRGDRCFVLFPHSSPDSPAYGDTMKALVRLVLVVASLVLNTTPSWGDIVTPTCHAPGCNPTTSDGSSNTAGGTNALLGMSDPGSLGVENTAFGAAALISNTAGSDNTAVGHFALFTNNNGIGNAAVGAFTLLFNTTGNNNTAIGAGALEHNTTANNNTATGSNALVNVSTGGNNTATGVLALNDNLTGMNNTAVGFKALKKSLGTKNIGIGYQAGVT